MPFSQTSGARSAWRDSAPSVTCWSVMAFYHQYICVLYRWNAQTYADPSLMRSLLPAANLACFVAPSNGQSDCFLQALSVIFCFLPCTLSVISLLSYLPHKRFHIYIYMKDDLNVGCKWAVFYIWGNDGFVVFLCVTGRSVFSTLGHMLWLKCLLVWLLAPLAQWAINCESAVELRKRNKCLLGCCFIFGSCCHRCWWVPDSDTDTVLQLSCGPLR